MTDYETITTTEYSRRSGAGYRKVRRWLRAGTLPPPAVIWRDGDGVRYVQVPRGWGTSPKAEAVP